MKPITPWTAERIQQLKDLWAQGMTARQIAVTLGGGITRNAIIGKANRIGLGIPKEKPAPRKVMVAGPANSNGCRWPIGHPGEAGFHFCEKKAMQGGPYCVEHRARAYRSRDEEAAGAAGG